MGDLYESFRETRCLSHQNCTEEKDIISSETPVNIYTNTGDDISQRHNILSRKPHKTSGNIGSLKLRANVGEG